MLAQFRLKNVRRQFVVLTSALIGLLFGLLLLVQYFALPDVEEGKALTQLVFESLALLIAGLIGGAITAGFVVIMFNVLYEHDRAAATVEVLDPATTKTEHFSALASTDFWKHNGHLGRWVRLEVLPALDAAGKRKGTTKQVVFIIIDPSSESACRQYASYRSNLEYDDPDASSILDVRVDLLATIVTAAISSMSSHLDIELYLKSYVNFSRLDISSVVAFLTLPDPRNLSVAYRNLPDYRRHSFYDAALLTFDAAMDSARHIDLDVSSLPVADERITPQHVEEFLRLNHLADMIDLVDPQLVIERLGSDFHPYK